MTNAEKAKPADTGQSVASSSYSSIRSDPGRATIAPLASSLLLARLRDANALMADGEKYIRGGTEGIFLTYWHLGRKAASMMALEAPSFFLLKSASVMEVSMVTGGPSFLPTMPEKVNFSNAPFVVL